MADMKKTITLLHVCNYASSYRGNFIDSIDSLEKTNGDVKNLYLFPERISRTHADKWITQMNKENTVAYVQEKSFLKNILLLRKIIKINNVDFVFRHFADFKMDIIIKLLFNSRRVVRFIHSTYQREEISNFKQWLRNIVWNKNILIGISEAVTSQLKEVFPKFSIHTIENAICFERLEKKDCFEKPKGISLLSMGYNLKVKGTDMAICVTEKLRKKYDVSLYIPVAGSKEKLLNYINQKFGCIPEWIVILPPIENIATYYNAIDVFLSPSRQEGFGYAVVEAAYCEKSIVASRVGGQAELDIDGVYWFESENLNDLYEKTEMAILQSNLESTVLRKKKVKEAVQTRYDIKKWCDGVFNVLEINN